MKKIIIIFCVLFLFVGCTNGEYTVKFNSNGGSLIDNQIIKKGELLTKPVDPTKDGYSFSGWELNNKEFKFNEPVKKDLTLNSLWVPNGSAKTYNVIFDNDGTKTTEVVSEGKVVKEPEPPIKNGSVFLGWYFNDEEEPYNFDLIINSDIILVAKYKEGPVENNGGISNQTIFITDLKISSEKLIIARNETVQINIEFIPENATDKKVTYSSSNRRIASISNSGLVKGLRAGDTTITVKTNDTSEITRELKITVTN